MHDVDDTIAAIASASGGALRGIIRIAGPQTFPCLAGWFHSDTTQDLSQVGSASVLAGQLQLGESLGLVPCTAYLWPTSRSYTRQPTVELHTLGSAPILEATLARVCQAGARLAAPGEFTMRAFLAGRLDLTQAEAVLGVIDATSREELDVALSQLAGGLAQPLHTLRDQLIDLLADLEAGLDFVEDDIEFITSEAVVLLLDQAAVGVQAVQDQLQHRGRTDELPQVVFVGCTNVGKSSLLNALAADAAAIVADVAGTTRDYVSRRVTWNGLEVLLIDTAGVDAAAVTGLDAAAQSVTVAQQQQAALVILCIDASRPLTSWEQAELTRTNATPRLVVLTKSDLADRMPAMASAVSTSSLTGTGIETLRNAIRSALADVASSAVAGTAIRCRDSLRLACDSLHRARQIAAESLGDELVAAEVRVALEQLGTVVGEVYTDDILDRIFSRFCIGK